MKTLSKSEISQWLQSHGIFPAEKKQFDVCASLPPEASRCAWLSKFIQETLQPWDECLLWVSEWMVWPSSENWPLYYRVRESYGDKRLLIDAPGHLFSKNEEQDLVNILQIGLMSGWDISIFPSNDHKQFFVSHDEWFGFSFVDKVIAKEFREKLAEVKIDVF